MKETRSEYWKRHMDEVRADPVKLALWKLRRKRTKARHVRKIRLENPAKLHLANVIYKRRSIKGPYFTLREWDILVAKLKGKCGYCGQRKPLTVDHKIPLSRGGGNTIDNIMPACLSCNTRKRNRTDVEFFAFLRKGGAA